MAVRSLQSLGTSILTQAAVLTPEVQAALPPLPSNMAYATPWVVSTGNLEADVLRGASEGIYAIEKPTFSKPSILEGLKEFALFAGSFFSSKGTSLVSTTAQQYQASRIPTPAVKVEGTMGLFDDIWGGIQNVGTTIFPTNQGIDWNNVLNQGFGLATQALLPGTSAVAARMAASGPAMQAARSLPMMASAGAGTAIVARGFLSRFPNLATAIQGLRDSGMNVTRSKLYGVMKRFGPEFLISGGLLTAAAVNELAVAGPGHRRMNPANVRALRRSVRRIESFHKLCQTTDRLRGRSRRKKC